MNKAYTIKVIFKGRVQGVFFRDAVKKQAQELNITGYVKNLEDGSVEMIAYGKKAVIEELLNQISKYPGFAKITSMEKEYIENTQVFETFEIKY